MRLLVSPDQPGRRHASELRRPGHPGSPPGTDPHQKSSHKASSGASRWITAASRAATPQQRSSRLGQRSSSSQATPDGEGYPRCWFNQPKAVPSSECQMHPFAPPPSPVHGSIGFGQHQCQVSPALAHNNPMLTVTPRTAGRPSAGRLYLAADPVQMSWAIWHAHASHDDGELARHRCAHQIVLLRTSGHQHPAT